MKKLFCIITASALIFTCTACGTKKQQSSTSTSGNNSSSISADVVSWKVSDDTITFSGRTRMSDYNTYEVENGSIPWLTEKDKFSAVVIEEGVTYIGNFAFYGFKDIKTAEIAGSVDSIGSSAFSGCESLTFVTLNEGTREIGPGAFGQCKSLTKINIPSSVTTIKKGAFYGCSSLTELTIPETVQVFGDADIFTGCTSLTIHCKEGSEAHAQAEKYGIPYDFNI